MPLFALIPLTLLKPAITFNPEIAALPVIVDQLAKQSGMKLKVAKNVQKEILAVIAPTGTPAEIMAQIAFATEAEWQKAGDEYTLLRTAAQLKEQHARHLKSRGNAIQTALDKLPAETPWSEAEARALAQRMVDFNTANQNTSSVSSEMTDPIVKRLPAQRGTVRLLRAFGGFFLAQLPLNTRVVFAVNPRRSQSPLPAACVRELKQLEKEINDLAGNWTSTSGRGYFYDLAALPSGYRLLVSLQCASNSCEIKVSAFTPAGERIFNTSLNVDPFAAGIKLENPPEETYVKLGPITQELIDIALNSKGRQVKASRELLAYLRHPKANEPNAILHLEALHAVADKSGKPIVASLTDSVLNAYSWAPIAGKVKVARYERAMKTLYGGELHDGWQVFRPRDPEAAQASRVNRDFVEAMGQASDRGPITLETYAEIVLKCPDRLENTSYTNLLYRAEMPLPGTGGSNNLDGLRFFGLLSDAQKGGLRTGQVLTPENFSRDQNAVISRMVYTQDWPNRDSMMDATNNQMTAIERESTELYPDGLAAPFKVSARYQSGPAWFRDTGFGSNYPTSTYDSAYRIFEKERPDLFPWASTYDKQLDRPYREGNQLDWDFRCQINPQDTGHFFLSDNRVGTGALLSLKDLPQSWQDEVAKELVRVREMYKDMKPPNQGSTKPPK